MLRTDVLATLCSKEEGKKGRHDAEEHKGEFDEKKGHKKQHHNEGGYHAKNEEGKKGEKGHAFHEEGTFKKGHSTKGKHVIHKLDESKKDTKFFEEDDDEGYDEQHGDFHEQHGSKKGGAHKKGHHQSTSDHGEHGKKGHSKKGRHHHDESGTKLLLCAHEVRNYNDIPFRNANLLHLSLETEPNRRSIRPSGRTQR